jgi:excinuclease ABC subunit A
MGHTVLVIEHDLDVIARADYLIEIGPEGGELGGELLYSGKPSNINGIKSSPTKDALLKQKSLHMRQ